MPKTKFTKNIRYVKDNKVNTGTQNFTKKDIKKLKKNIKKFTKLRFEKLSIDEINHKFQEVLLSAKKYTHALIKGEMPKGSIFCRIVNVSKNIDDINKSWFWELEPNYTKMNRFNLDFEQVLYTCEADPVLAVRESKVNYDNKFFLVIYEATEPIEFTTIELSSNDLIKYNIYFRDYIELMHNFIKSWIGIDINQESERYLYKVTNAIKKEFIMEQDAHRYYSVFSEERYNMCFSKEAAHKKLKVINVTYNELVNINPYLAYLELKETKRIDYNAEDIDFEKSIVLNQFLFLDIKSLEKEKLSWSKVNSSVPYFIYKNNKIIKKFERTPLKQTL